MKNTMRKFIPLIMVLSSAALVYVNQQAYAETTLSGSKASEATQKLIYKGKIVGKSNKAKQVSMMVGKGSDAKNIMISFDDNTKGIQYAIKGHGAIVHYEMRKGKPFATLIKAKLAKLPPGSSEISVAGVDQLLTAHSDFVLIDSRPGQRYAESHLPTAISIPVCSMKELIDLLPKDKDQLLVFYCGGRT
ncbi:MAG: rhodanese-like domain-containing protein [Spirochaetales bacterium]|jgi:hypothetical protein|nr:rhodanese-like domain-containing protein [Spirochaetales bacterium]